MSVDEKLFDEKLFDENIHALIRLSDTIDELQFTADSLQGRGRRPKRIPFVESNTLISLQRVKAIACPEILKRKRAIYCTSVQEEIQHLMNFLSRHREYRGSSFQIDCSHATTIRVD